MQESRQTREECSVCGLKKVCSEGGLVLFQPSMGAPFTPETAREKVCQYASRHGCINDFSDFASSSRSTGSDPLLESLRERKEKGYQALDEAFDSFWPEIDHSEMAHHLSQRHAEPMGGVRVGQKWVQERNDSITPEPIVIAAIATHPDDYMPLVIFSDKDHLALPELFFALFPEGGGFVAVEQVEAHRTKVEFIREEGFAVKTDITEGDYRWCELEKIPQELRIYAPDQWNQIDKTIGPLFAAKGPDFLRGYRLQGGGAGFGESWKSKGGGIFGN